jgi:CheY-like chemotaxis protein
MSIEKINDILSSTGELNKEEMEYLEKKEFNFKVCQKVVKIMGGNLMIKSTIGKGTDITLTLDQRVYHEKENTILNQFEAAVSTNRRVLIVAQNKDLAGYLKKKLNNNDITYSALAYGGDAVDRIKAGKSYDYMLIEDDMKEMSGLATLQELQKLKNFDIPVIIMLNKDKDSIKEHYIEDGFTDYLLTENIEDEIKRIIDKY